MSTAESWRRPPPEAEEVIARIRQRGSLRLRSMSDEAVLDLLSECVHTERRRFDAMTSPSDEDRAEEEAIEAVAGAVRQDRRAQEEAILDLAGRYADEIHNRFSPRTYRFATRLLPGALTRLLTATDPRELLEGEFDPRSRLIVQGPTQLLSRLGEEHTLILAPTHLSNLDSPLLGYGLYAAGLPPFIYGAGLNLFSNPAMAFFMSRLGAYTVDRRKKQELYKQVLKDYSTESIGRGAHSLFFPGGTRARNGMVEKKLKMGLLGTGITAWQEGLEQGRPRPEVLVVPCTLSYTLVLEAETLIEDALAEAGKQRYIITDDEFSEPRTIASFARRVLSLDSSVYIRFGAPLDLMGNPVDEDGRSLDPQGRVVDRRAYVTDRLGRVVWDPQRDRIYTDHLAQSLISAYHRDNVVLSTHLCAFAAWNQLRAAWPRLDTWQLVAAGRDQRQLHRAELLAAIDRLIAEIGRRCEAGRLQQALPHRGGLSPAEAALEQALDAFGRYHKRRALAAQGNQIHVDPRLALYYSNRLVGYDLEAIASQRSGANP
jgi:glycerol-3-phosphate O-acyltransferase